MNYNDYIRDMLILTGVAIVCMILCLLVGLHRGEGEGYIKALVDIKKGNPPKYVMVEQSDGTTRWQENK